MRDPWPKELLADYRSNCPLGTRDRMVMELCFGAGQRIGDAIEMRCSTIQDGAIVEKQNKTGNELWDPILPKLQAALDVASRHSVFFLSDERGTNHWSYRRTS